MISSGLFILTCSTDITHKLLELQKIGFSYYKCMSILVILSQIYFWEVITNILALVDNYFVIRVKHKIKAWRLPHLRDNHD